MYHYKSFFSYLRQILRKKRLIIIHIGHHKTATTSIQRFLFSHRQTLASYGILYPSSGLFGETGQHNLAWELSGDDRFSAENGTVSDLLGELQRSEAKLAILSSEDLEYLVQAPRSLSDFQRKLTSIGFEPIYLAVFRDCQSYAESLFNELLKHGLQMSRQTFMDEITTKESFTTEQNWHFEFNRKRFERNWNEMTGCKLAALPYNHADMLTPFLKFIGAPQSLINESISAHRFNARS